MIDRYINKSFEERIPPIIGADFGSKIITIDYQMKLQICQVASQEIYRGPHYNVFYKGAHGIIFVLDITDEDSLSDLNNWIRDVKEAIDPCKDERVYFLCANKCDLEDNRKITREQMKEFYKSNFNEKEMNIFEVSAKTGENINKMFYELAVSIFKKQNF